MTHYKLGGISILFLFLTFCLSVSVCSQKALAPAWIVKSDGDSISGELRIKPEQYFSKCEFREYGSYEFEAYGPEDIREFRIVNGRYFVAKEVVIDSVYEKVFLEFLVNGISDLYYLQKGLDHYYFIEKDESGLVILESYEIRTENEYGDIKARQIDSYRGVLKYTFRDAPQLYGKIENTGFNHKSLIDITTDYHNQVCDEYSCEVYAKTVNERYWIAPQLGVSFCRAKYLDSPEYASWSSMEYGLKFYSYSVLSNFHLSAYSGILISSVEFDQLFTHHLSKFVETNRMEVSYNLITIPVGVQYNFGKKRLHPTLSAELDFVFPVNATTRIYTDDDAPINHPDLNSFQLGGSMGAGFEYKLNDNLKIYLQAGYRIYGVLINEDRLDPLTHHSLNTVIGLMINLDR